MLLELPLLRNTQGHHHYFSTEDIVQVSWCMGFAREITVEDSPDKNKMTVIQLIFLHMRLDCA